MSFFYIMITTFLTWNMNRKGSNITSSYFFTVGENKWMNKPRSNTLNVFNKKKIM